MPRTILVIDDDEKLNRLLKRFLRDYNYEVYSAIDADEGFKKIRTVMPDLIILDIMLPGMTGFEVCKKIRESSTVPIIMLTAKADETDKIVGLEIGIGMTKNRSLSNILDAASVCSAVCSTVSSTLDAVAVGGARMKTPRIKTIAIDVRSKASVVIAMSSPGSPTMVASTIYFTGSSSGMVHSPLKYASVGS